MKYFKQTKAIGTLFAIASVLLAVACFTITNTFAYPDRYDNKKSWDITLTDLKANKLDSEVYSKGESMTVNVTLTEPGDVLTVYGNIENNGDFNAYLNNISMTDLSNFKIGTSDETGITYYLSDYVDANIKYTRDNKTNLITEGYGLRVGDKLNKYTKNYIVLSVKYRDISNLSQDALVVLKQNVLGSNGEGALKFSMNVILKFMENTK